MWVFCAYGFFVTRPGRDTHILLYSYCLSRYYDERLYY